MPIPDFSLPRSVSEIIHAAERVNYPVVYATGADIVDPGAIGNNNSLVQLRENLATN
jgi:hypothetical protein